MEKTDIFNLSQILDFTFFKIVIGFIKIWLVGVVLISLSMIIHFLYKNFSKLIDILKGT